MTTYRWTKVTENAPFAARDGAMALTFNNRMWLLGGWNPLDPLFFPKICNSEVWSSPDGVAWKLDLRQAPWEGRHTAGCVVHRGRMWIVGGDCNQGHYQNEVWSSVDGSTWKKVCDPVPWGQRVLQTTVAFKGRIWIMGGQTIPQIAPENEVFYSDVWNSADGVKWKCVTQKTPWGPRGLIGGSVVFKGRMWILGGGTYDTPKKPNRKFFNDVWSSADGARWKCHTKSAAWAPRQYHDVAVFDGRMWVMEGYQRGVGNLKDVWHSADGVNWEEVPGTPWLPRHAASVFVHDGALWIMVGNNMTPDIWKLTRE